MSRWSSGSPPAIETAGAPHSSIAVHASSYRQALVRGSRRDSRSCRSRRRPGCSGTAAPASAPADIACGRRDAASSHRRRSGRLGAGEFPWRAYRTVVAVVVRGVGSSDLNSAGRRNSMFSLLAVHRLDLNRRRCRRSASMTSCDQLLRRRGAGGESHHCTPLHPFRLELAAVIDQVGGHALSTPISRRRLELELLGRPPPAARRPPRPVRAPRSGGSGWRSRCRERSGPTMSVKRAFSAAMMPRVSSTVRVVWVT